MKFHYYSKFTAEVPGFIRWLLSSDLLQRLLCSSRMKIYYFLHMELFKW